MSRIRNRGSAGFQGQEEATARSYGVEDSRARSPTCCSRYNSIQRPRAVASRGHDWKRQEELSGGGERFAQDSATTRATGVWRSQGSPLCAGNEVLATGRLARGRFHVVFRRSTFANSSADHLPSHSTHSTTYYSHLSRRVVPSATRRVGARDLAGHVVDSS